MAGAEEDTCSIIRPDKGGQAVGGMGVWEGDGAAFHYCSCLLIYRV